VPGEGDVLLSQTTASPVRMGFGTEQGRMSAMEAIDAPSAHTPDGGVLVGSDGARRRLVVFEDPQCPYCREFEDVSGDRLRREVASGAVAVEYRIRSFLGEESVRAANALAVAAESGRFDELRREVFVNQPPEHSGGFTTEDLLDLGRRVGLTGSDFVTAVKQGRYEGWVREIEEVFEGQDPGGTPFAVLDGRPVDSGTLYDPDALGALIRS
jgi:Thioredoxin